MYEQIANFFAGLLNEKTAIFFMSMLPAIETNVSIPLGILHFKIAPLTVLIIAIAGNIVPSFFLLKWLEPMAHLVTSRIKLADKIFQYIIHRTRVKHSKTFTRFGAVFLVSLMALPGPGSGAWTGSLISFLFNIPYKKALPLIFCGVVIGSTVTTIITIGAGEVFTYLKSIF